MTVFVWGCARSGTSITFEIFKAHPAFRYFFEPGSWLLKDIDFSYPTAIKNPWSREPTPGLSANLDEVLSIPARHIWVVRNPYDTVVSLLPGMAEQPHPPALPERWKDKPVLDRAAALWRYVNETGLENLQAKVRVRVVRYEALLENPDDTISQLLDYAGVSWTPEMASFSSRISNVPGKDEAEFQSRWHTPHESHTNRELSELDRVTIANIIGDVPKRFGYE